MNILYIQIQINYIEGAIQSQTKTTLFYNTWQSHLHNSVKAWINNIKGERKRNYVSLTKAE